MARPRTFDHSSVLKQVLDTFWLQGYEGTSMRDLTDRTGLTGPSLYNAFGDKSALYRQALDHYVDTTISARIARCESQPPRQAIETFFKEVVSRSLNDSDQKGCMLVNAAMADKPDDPQLQRDIAAILEQVERFFYQCVKSGQKDGSISLRLPARDLARNLLAVLMGIRVFARVRPEPRLLQGAVTSALALLDED
ncbi:TetR/AcrR family transcriptional regulator [Microbulbifer sp. TYP-18]|uniref:TetR/AcrR family transcriptional regulator n=1 Tax=Microbulbifer sp. TYP-18 TaxID=3230024 RepID=UPI0034C5F505